MYSILYILLAGDKHTLIGFVVLTSKNGIPTALKLNGHFLAPKDGSSDTGRHIRVDVSNRQKHNNQNSIFIGNLPFSANEEEVWDRLMSPVLRSLCTYMYFLICRSVVFFRNLELLKVLD